MKFILAIVILSLVISGLFISSVIDVQAAIVPCATSTSPDMCTICHLAVGIWEIIDFIKNLVFITSVVIIMVAGIMYIVSTGNQQITTMAKTAIKTALIGTIVVLVSFLVITFILNAIFNTNTLGGEGSTLKVDYSIWEFDCQ
jgi:cytochrome bd-type quinol oxidase subunit 2